MLFRVFHTPFILSFTCEWGELEGGVLSLSEREQFHYMFQHEKSLYTFYSIKEIRLIRLSINLDL